MKRLSGVLAIGLAVVLAACSETPEARQQREQAIIAEAAQLVAAKKFSEAYVKLDRVAETPQVAELRRKAADGQEQQEAEMLAAQALEAAKSIKAEIDALDASSVVAIAGVKQALNTFDRANGFLTRYEPSSLDEAGKSLRASIRTTLARKQAALLPSMRSTYAKDLAETLWKNDVEVVASGGGNRRIKFIAGMFAANRNIAAAQEAASPMLGKLRFSRSQYEWYRGSEFTYYDLKPDADGHVPD